MPKQEREISISFTISHETYGLPRMHVEFNEDGVPVALNLLDQGFACDCDGPDQKLGVDISYVWTHEG